MIKKIVGIFLLFSISLSCSEDEVNKAEFLPGYWQVDRNTTTFINGILSAKTSTRSYVDFFDDNCGQLYDHDKNPTSKIKWAFQERDTIDLLLISTALLTSDGTSSSLYMNELSAVEDIEERYMLIFNDNEKVIDGDDYSINNWINFVKLR